ncbi:hypothetical protein [Holophaga foetida]|uniref:hypothetical protein n=1 Tax=Holophaga foetida TaxID=35839 RepID=UPI0011DD3818|nr:hypothetical protein [Holophaga foetida]
MIVLLVARWIIVFASYIIGYFFNEIFIGIALFVGAPWAIILEHIQKYCHIHIKASERFLNFSFLLLFIVILPVAIDWFVFALYQFANKMINNRKQSV